MYSVPVIQFSLLTYSFFPLQELNSKNFAKGRRFSIPFVMENEPSSLQAELLAAYGPNTSNVEVDRLMNKLAHHLVSTGDVPNSIL